MQESPKQLRRTMWLIMFSLVSVGMGQTLVFAILPSLGRELGLKEIQVGAIITGSALVFSLCSPVWGRTSDRWGRKAVMLVGLVGYTLGTVLFASTFFAGFQQWLQGTTLFVALIVARMLQASVMSATNPAATAYIADTTSADMRTRGMAKVAAAHNLGTIIGPAVAGGMVFISLLAPLYMAAVTTLIASILVGIWIKEPPVHRSGRSPTQKMSFFDSRVMPFILIGVSMFMAFAVMQQTLGFLIQDELQLNGADAAKRVSLALMCSAGASLGAQLLLVQNFSFKPLTLLKMGLPLKMLGAVALAFSHTEIGFAGSMLLVGMGLGLCVPGFSSAATLVVEPHEQGAVAGLIGACPAMGFIAGPLIGTSLYSIDHILPYLTTALIFVPIQWYVWRI